MPIVNHCADCLYYAKDPLTEDVKCKYPLECEHKKLFKRKQNEDTKDDIITKLKQYIRDYGWCGYHGERHEELDDYNKDRCDWCCDKDGCERYNILKL